VVAGPADHHAKHFEEDDEQLDVVKVMMQRKKKLILKEKKFEFYSIKDVFELREEGKDMEQHIIMNKQILLQ
jgi:hypothetical protein